MAASKQKLPLLTRTENEVMHALWRVRRGTVNDVIAELERPMAYTSVMTMLRILEKKGYATHSADASEGRAFVYTPTVGEVSARKSHVRDLVQRLFGGSATTLVTGLLDDEGLSREELELIRDKVDRQLAARKR